MLVLSLCLRGEKADLAFTAANDAAIDRIRATSNLTTLDLSRAEITDAGFERLQDLPAVEALNLYYAEFLSDAALSHLRGWKRLRRLNLRGADITDAGLAHVSNIASLESLDISFTLITNVGLDHLVRLPHLRELALGGNKITGAGLHVLKSLPALARLDLHGVQRRNTESWSASITDFDLDLLASLTALEDLHLGGARITDRGVAKLQPLARLRALDLSRTAVTGASLDALPRLERISLWKSGVTDSGLPRLAALRSLSWLDLADTAVTDRALDHLRDLTPLRDLYLDGSRVTDAGVEQFRRARPECRVHWK